MALKIDYVGQLTWDEKTGDFIGPDGRIIRKPELGNMPSILELVKEKRRSDSLEMQRLRNENKRLLEIVKTCAEALRTLDEAIKFLEQKKNSS